MNGKYVKVMFGTTSGANKNVEYKLDEVNVAKTWNPDKTDPREMGGFNFSVPDKILRWLHRGDTIYDVILPENAQIVDVVGSATPHGVLRSNKIILTNPRKITDEMAMEFYKISTIPEKAYYNAMAVCAIMDYDKTAKQILKDKVNKNNVEEVLNEWDDFVNKYEERKGHQTVKDIRKELCDIKNS